MFMLESMDERERAFKHQEGELKKKAGELVRRLRRAKQWTQEDLADASGYHTNYIGLIERAERQMTLGAAARIAAALDTKLAEFCQELEV